jgi:hypothetical protein
MSKLVPVSKAAPCPVCGGDHKCGTTAAGLVLCGRRDGDVPGFRRLGPCKDPTWTKYSPADERRTVRSPVSLPNTGGLTPRRSPPPASLGDLADRLARNLTPDRAADLAGRLGLPARTLALMPEVGFDPDGGCWTFPEYDPAGFVVGIVRRFPDGSKRAVPGSHRGLSLAGGWADARGPVFVVEGPTDVLALAACGLPAVGRPSNCGGADLLGKLFAGLPADRPVVVVGENDRKPDGLWPGRDGARRVADDLARSLGRAVLVALPPADYKDAREWVVDRYQGASEAFDWAALGADVARDLVATALAVEPGPRKETTATFGGVALGRRRFPTPVPIAELQAPGPGGVAWVWDGFLGRNAVTLLSALPKCGKTTLLSHLLAAVGSGGLFCGRPLVPGRALVVSEEPAGVWADRRDKVGIPPDAVRLITRNQMPRCGSLDEWAEFVGFLGEQCDADPTDLVVIDTLANVWPVKDENSAAEMGAALAPLGRLAKDRSVLLVHHLRKSDGAEGTGSRGSGALVGAVDVVLELRRVKRSLDPSQRKRVLSGYGRFDAIPAEWVVELTDGDRPGFAHVPDAADREQRAASRVGTREAKEDSRVDALREALCGVIPFAPEGGGLTRAEIWDRLPPAVKVNELRLREVLDGEQELWIKDGTGTRGKPFRYRRKEGMGGCGLPD